MNARATLLSALVAGLILGALYGWTVGPTIGVLHGTVDSAELVSVAAVLGVAHPSGEALWLPLARLALGVVPAAEPALRTNLLSVVLMALAGALVSVAACRWRPETPWWGAASTGLFFGLAPVVWAQATVTEVYALEAVLAALALVLGADASRGRHWRVFAFVLGLLVASHLTGLALAFPILVAALAGSRGPRGRETAWCAGLFLLPMAYSVAYLWLRADAAIAWGDTGSLRGLSDHFLGATYRDALERSPRMVASAVPETVRNALGQLPPPAWLLLIPGAFAVARTRGALALVLGVWFALLTVFISAYPVSGREDYLQGTTMALALFAGWGVVSAWDWATQRLRDRGARAALGLVAVGLFGLWAVWVGHDVSRRGDTTLVKEARAALAGVPEDGRVDTFDDRQTFPLWYVTTVLHEREDVTVVDVRQVAPRVGPRP
ncbi:MAG: DUF2723 domain-containing protein [Dehalococcoidia bacterium]|nr:MAG: DUF2723 domain-containing protein [Dehalococcoidia bacterium]